MLPERRWKADAVVRLLLSVFVCYFTGSIIVGVMEALRSGRKLTPGFFAIATTAAVFLAAMPFLARRPWTLENFTRRILVLLVCFWVGLTAGSWTLKLSGPLPTVMSAGQLTVAILSFQGALLLFTPLFLRDHELSFSEAFGWSNQWVHALMYGIIAGCIFLPVGQVLQWASVQIMENLPHIHFQPQEQSAVQTVRNASSLAHRLVLGGGTIVVAPFAEEILFRGILYPCVKAAGFPRIALWGTAIAFGAVHMNMMNFLPLFVLALVLTLLYEKTRNLMAPIAAHSLFNAVNFVMLLVQTSSNPPY